jgi:3-hydroxyisobutyrate dehydrogenase-like beta-hydroxyacid dehydrogenase
MHTVGFIGLGSMGKSIAGNLVDEGYDVIVWNRSKAPVAALVAAGARSARSPGEALAAPVSFSMLANDEATEQVLTPENLKSAAGKTHVCMASLSPAATDRLSELSLSCGVAYVAAPVLGRPEVAARGEVNILASGSPAVVAGLAPYFEAIGSKTWVVGTVPRRANVVKIAVNYNIIHAIQALAESVALVEAHGIPSPEFVGLLSSTLFGGVVYRGYGSLIAERRYRPAGFTVALGRKDLGLAELAASEVGLTLPTEAALREVFETALASPYLHDADWSSIAEVTRNGSIPR